MLIFKATKPSMCTQWNWKFRNGKNLNFKASKANNLQLRISSFSGLY